MFGTTSELESSPACLAKIAAGVKRYPSSVSMRLDQPALQLSQIPGSPKKTLVWSSLPADGLVHIQQFLNWEV
jgi:hypothetical protein